MGDARRRLFSEDEARRQKPTFEVFDALPLRPFTPPVVPVGKLLRGVYDTKRLNVADTERSCASTSAEPCQRQDAAWPAQIASTAPSVSEDNIDHHSGQGSGKSKCDSDEAVAIDEQMLEAIYDPVLDVYYDPRSNKYYERRHITSDLHDVEKN
jgi:hypothetical protein